MRQLVYTMFISNNHAWFHLWWKEKLVKHQEVSKSYKKDCRREYVTLKTSFIQPTRCQCCHNHLKSICFKEGASTRSWTNVHYLLDSCHVMTWSKCHMTFGWGLLILVTTLISLWALRPVKVKKKYFWFATWPHHQIVTWICGWGSLIINLGYCHVTTWSKCHMTFLVWFLHPC